MRCLIGIGAFAACAVLVLGCGSSGPGTPALLTVGSYLGDAWAAVGDPPSTQLVANLGLVVRGDGSVEGAFFTGQEQGGAGATPNYDSYISGTWSGSEMQASGVLIGDQGTSEVGSVTLSGTWTYTQTQGWYIEGTFTAAGIGSGFWRGYFYSASSPRGCYAGAYAGDRQGSIAIMNFALDDTVIILKEAQQPRTDYFAAPDILRPPTQPGGDYTLVADGSWYCTGLTLSGIVGLLAASGSWQQPQGTATLSGTWAADRPESRAAGRALSPAVARVHRVRRQR